MARLKTASALLVPLLSRASALQYQLVQEYNASNIFDEFDFFSGPDPTGGFVQYVTKEVAASTPLIGNSSDLIYIGVDDSNVYTPGGVGRPSVRLQSKLTFTEGLFVIDLTHIPVGCGTWPALWTTGLNDWPADGEIDIIENVNDARANNAAIHATGDCLVDAATSQTGTWKSTDCSIGHDDNQGCGTVLTEPFNYGAEFNANGGGVYAMEWTSETIKIWFFPPTNVPLTLSSGGVPDSASFGTPSSIFNGSCSGSFSEKFFNHSIIIDTTFCGGWAGGTFGTGSSSCPIREGLSPQDSCIEFVANSPDAFKDAYWGIRSVKVWEKVPGFTVQDLATPGVDLPPPGVALTSPVATMEPLDVLIKGPISWNVSKPIAAEQLDVSPLTGGVLSAGDDSEDTLDDDDSEDVWDDDDITGDDLDNDLDAVDDFIDLGSLDDILGASIFDTEEPSGIIIDIDIDPATSDAAALLDQVATTLYGGGILDIPSASPTAASILVPFGVGNTEGHKDLFLPELSLPVPTKGPRIPASNGNTGIVPPHLQQLPPVRQQNPVPSGEAGIQILNNLPLLLPQPVDNAAQTGLIPLQVDTPLVTAPEFAAPELAAPVAVPQLNASALTIPAVDASVSEVNPLLTPPKHSNPLIPAGIGNTGIVPPSISESPIVSLWSSFGTELKNKLIVAATNLSPPFPGSSPLTDLWASLSPELKSEVLNAAKNLPASTPENSVPTISDLINAASTGKVMNIPNIPGLPALDAPPAVKSSGGLLGFLDARTKNKLKALLGQITAPPTDSDVRKRQITFPDSLASGLVPGAPLAKLQPMPDPSGVVSGVSDPLSQPVASNPRPLAGLAQDTVPYTLSQPVANNLRPLPGLAPGLVAGAPSANSPPISGLIDGTVSKPLSQPVASNPQPLAGLAQSTVPNTPSQSFEDALQQLSSLLNTVPNNFLSTVPNAATQPISPPLKLTPNVPVTALTSTDTTKAMNGLLSLLDDSTKDQIANLLLGPDSSTTDVSQPAIDAVNEVKRRSDAPWKILQTWNEAKQSLSDETLYKLDSIIKTVANLNGNVAGVPTNKIWDILNTRLIARLKLSIASIDEEDRMKLAEFLTGDRNVFDSIDGAMQAFGLQDIMNASNDYAKSPNDDTMNVFMEVFQDAASSIYDQNLSDKNNSKENTGLTRRQSTTVWSPQDKLALAQNVYALCPAPALVGIPFPSPNNLAVELSDPSKTLEDALAVFQRKLQAYFDITVQGCWTKINQWLAWRQLLSKPGTSHILPYPLPLPKRAMRFHARQKDDGGIEGSDPQGYLEQQIYTICPKPDTFSPAVDQLIADLEDKNITMTIAISKFQNRLWAYMAKLQECSDKIRQYGPKLKALSGTPSTEPVFHTTTNHKEMKRHHARQIPPSVVSATNLLNHLTKLQQNGISYKDLPFDDQKNIYEALLAGTSAGWPGNPRDQEELQHLVFQLTQATAPHPWGAVSPVSPNTGKPGSSGPDPIGPSMYAPQPSGDDHDGASEPSDDDAGDAPAPAPGSDGPPSSDNSGSPGLVDENGDAFGSDDGDDMPPPSEDDLGHGGSDIKLPVDEGGPDGGFDDGIYTPPGSGGDSTGDGSTDDNTEDDSTGDNGTGDENLASDGINGFVPGEPNPSAPDASDTDDGAGAGSGGSNGVDPDENGNPNEPGDGSESLPVEDGDAAAPEGDTESGPSSDPSGPGSESFSGSPTDDDSSGAPVDDGSSEFPVDDGSADAPIDDGSQDTAPVGDSLTAPSEVNTPSTAPPEDPIPADDPGLAPETTSTDEDTQDTAPFIDNNILLPSDTTTGDANPAFDIEPSGPRFRSRILRSLAADLKRQDQSDANGVIPDIETPADLDAILGPHGTLDPFGFLGPQIASPPSPLDTQDPHDSPTAADDAVLYDLPDTAVDEASPDVDAALQAGEQDPFGQLTYSKDDSSAEDAGETWESKEFLGKLRDHEASVQSGKYLSDPRDVDDFVKKFYQGDGQ
ncbi:hypothetical protein PMIN04_007416 [Paraphaeosphaeria minitans]